MDHRSTHLTPSLPQHRFEEACKVAALNASGSGPHVILGGTCIHNSSRWVPPPSPPLPPSFLPA